MNRERHSPYIGEDSLGGESKEVLSEFPRDVKVNLGYSLRRLQKGEFPVCQTRPMTSLGKGVRELEESDARAWYRLICLTKIDSVLHL